MYDMGATFLGINYFDWLEIGSPTIQFYSPLEAALSEWMIGATAECAGWSAECIHIHHPSERHADGRGMTEEDDCVITQVQEHVVLLVKFNSQTSQFQMFHKVWNDSEKESGHHWLLLTAGYLFIIYHVAPSSSTLQDSRDVLYVCRVSAVLSVYLLCTCTELPVQKQGLCLCDHQAS